MPRRVERSRSSGSFNKKTSGLSTHNFETQTYSFTYESRKVSKKEKKQIMRREKKRLKDEQRKLKKQIEQERKAQKAITRQYEQVIKEANNPKKLPATSIDETLSYIHSNPRLNSNRTLSAYLRMALKKESGNPDFDFESGVHDLYTIDEGWDGNPNTVISHIKINKPFSDPTAQKYLNMITESDWGSEELHQRSLDKARRKAYHSNIGVEFSDQQLDYLELIMNSSAMWHIVGDQYGLTTGDYDSDQAKETWQIMHSYVQDLTELDPSHADLAEILHRIDNFDSRKAATPAELNEVLELVESKIKKYRGR